MVTGLNSVVVGVSVVVAAAAVVVVADESHSSGSAGGNGGCLYFRLVKWVIFCKGLLYEFS